MRRSFLLIVCVAVCAQAQVSVTVNRYDRSATGSDNAEHELNTKTVSTARFGKLFSYYVDGAVYAQPLYVPNVLTEKRGTRNVLYAATMNDKVYAFDASGGGSPVWMRDFTDETAGVTPVPISDITNSNELNIVGNAGIEGTRVIDLPSQAMFLVARTKESGKYVQRLHRLDIRNGQDQMPAVVIEASVPGSAADAVNGVVRFDARAGNQRPALAFANGMVVIAWASHEDLRPYHGWVMSYDAATLRQTGALCVTPDGADGGIWQSGRGPAVDESGALYFEVGNGGWDGKRNFGDSVIKVRSDASGLRVEDYYTPHDYAHQNETDADLGSTGPVLIPEKQILIGGNKQGAVFLLDAKKLGGMTAGDKGVLQNVKLSGGRFMAGPVYWEGPAGPVLFVWNETSFPQAFRWDGARLNPERSAKGSPMSHGSPGGALTVSSDGAKPGTGVLWATVGKNRSADHGNAAGVLYAFDANTLEELWDSERMPQRDRLGTLVKFVPPLVADGKVYVPTYDDCIQVYGVMQ